MYTDLEFYYARKLWFTLLFDVGEIFKKYSNFDRTKNNSTKYHPCPEVTTLKITFAIKPRCNIGNSKSKQNNNSTWYHPFPEEVSVYMKVVIIKASPLT